MTVRSTEYFPSNDQSLLTGQTKLARLYRLMGRYEEAYPLANNAVKQLSEQLGEDHPSAQSAIEELQTLEQAMVAQEQTL